VKSTGHPESSQGALSPGASESAPERSPGDGGRGHSACRDRFTRRLRPFVRPSPPSGGCSAKV
jgi:hypothetical protein